MSYRIAYQGVPHSFSYQAANIFINKELSCFTSSSPELIGTKSFEDIIKLVKTENVALGLLPIENSLAGSIYSNYDLLEQASLSVIGELILQVHHCLIAPAKASLNSITTIYSHPKALEQCLKFLGGSLPDGSKRSPYLQMISASTSHAAAFVAEQDNLNYGAIASEEASKAYNLQVLARNIEDHEQNFTRFLVIANEPLKQDDSRTKCSITFTLNHIPGALSQVLSVLAEHQANLTKIESRPLHGHPFEYRFYVDFISDHDDRREIDTLILNVSTLKVFGWYKPNTFEKSI